MATFLILCEITPVYAAPAIPSVVKTANYESQQLSDDALIQMAKQGNLVNNAITQVSKYTTSDSSGYKIKKLMSENVLSNGQTVYNIALIDSGETGKTYTSGSYTVQYYVHINFQHQVFSGSAYESYKIINYSCKCTLLDTSFIMTKLTQFASAAGTGHNANGGRVVNISEQSSYSVSNPVSNTTYSKSSGFTNWPDDNGSGYSGTGVLTTLTYKHGTTSYNFEKSVKVF